MTTLTQNLFQTIKDTSRLAEQKALLDAADLDILSPLSTLLAQEVDALKHDEPQQAAQMADLLLYLADLAANPSLSALALRAKGEVALFGLHDYAAAHDAYSEARQCYEQHDSELQMAEVEARLVCTLALQGCWDDAQRRFQCQQALLQRHEVLMPLAEALKKQGDRQTQKANGIPRATQFAKVILYLAELAADDFLQALGLRAEGNVHLYSHDYEVAVNCYSKAAQIYRRHDAELEAAWAEVGSVGAFAQWGRYTDAEAVYERISEVFEHYEQWVPLAAVTGNLMVMYGHLGQDVKALHFANRARRLLDKIPGEGDAYLPRIENNRAITLRNLGRFEESIQASQSAYEINMNRGQSAEAARALDNMALTYFLLGHYNQALQLYEKARKSFSDGGRKRDALITDLDAIDCLLQLRRFNNVLEKCSEIEDEVGDSGSQMNLAQSYLHKGTAYTSKYPAEYDKALQAVSQARIIFEQQGNQVWMAMSDLQVATILSLQGKDAQSLRLAQSCAGIFRDHALPVNEAQAWLTAAQAALRLEWYDLAYRLLLDASNIIAAQPKNTLPFLDYQIHHLLGRLAQRQAKYEQAEAEYQKAIETLELLRGRVMVEFTAGFLEDKQSLYEELVILYLKQLKDYPQAWTYAERAKSRALIDLLAHRIDLTIGARSAEDEPLVAELMALRAERSRLYRRLQEMRRTRERHLKDSLEREQQAEQEILGLEQQLEEKWQGLLQRNADYERDVSLSVVSLERVQAELSPEACLIEYFIADGQVFAFLITHHSIDVQPLAPLSKVKRWLKLLEMNLQAVASTKLSRIPALTTRAKGLLHHLYRLLMQPLANCIKPYRRLVIVPHGILHALPFHALYDKDQQAYLLEQYEISYLPSASVLHYCQQEQQMGEGALILAHTQGGTLPGREREGRLIQQLTKGAYLLDQEATLTNFHQQAATCRILHLATHGQFKADNPLFSGLALEDGELTTLDIFNSRLSASLVVLSACETARAKLGGGDELLGLSRAFLYAGATSLVVSQWKVEDQSTEQLMGAFYQHLMAGSGKAEALRKAQQQFIQQEKETIYTHPFFWSAFFLMGNAGEL